jgi:hypothetical protein
MMMVRSTVLAMPIQADGLFPKVCVDKDFAYENPQDAQTKLKALEDATEAYRLYSTCRYLLPKNFSLGIEKISSVVGLEVTRENARSLKEEMEIRMGILPERTSSPIQQITRKALKFLGL